MMARRTGVDWARHGFKVYARDEANVDRLGGELPDLAGDLAAGIADLVSQFTARLEVAYADTEIDEVVERALDIAPAYVAGSKT